MRNVQMLVMSPIDVTTIANERFAPDQLTTRSEREPVPMDRLTGGHRLLGVDMTSDPAVAVGTMWINGDLVDL